eukprot:m.259243 g.259243  ORF g.259243 m.259243 type:complete len:1240 (-) comp17586_c0_seq2:1291-5010(-)
MAKKSKGKRGKKPNKPNGKPSHAKAKAPTTAAESTLPTAETAISVATSNPAEPELQANSIEHLKQLPVMSVCVSIKTIHDVLLRSTGIAREEYDAACQRSTQTEAAIRESVAMVAKGINDAIQTGDTVAMEQAAEAAMAFAAGRDDVRVAAQAALAVAKSAKKQSDQLEEALEMAQQVKQAASNIKDAATQAAATDLEVADALARVDLTQIDDSVENITALYNGIQRILEQPFSLQDVDNQPTATNETFNQITEAEALEASIMAAMPHDIAERVYDQLETIGCQCPAQCGQVFPIEDLERHCLRHIEESAPGPPPPQGPPLPSLDPPTARSIPLARLSSKSAPAEQSAVLSSVAKMAAAASNQATGMGQHYLTPPSAQSLLAALPDHVLLDEPEEPKDPNLEAIPNSVQAFSETFAPLPPMLHGQSAVALVLPQADSLEYGTVEEQWDSLSDWLYTDADNSNEERFASMLPTFQAIHKRIATLTPLIDAKEQVLSIRSQVALNYQHKLAQLPNEMTLQEQLQAYNTVGDMVCMTTVLDSYLQITQRRRNVFEHDLKSVSSLGKRMQDSITELTRQVASHRSDLEEIDGLELKALQEQIVLLQESQRSKRPPPKSAFSTDMFRLRKADLSVKMDQCQRKIKKLKDQYARTLRMLVRTREKQAAQDAMAVKLSNLQRQCQEALIAIETRLPLHPQLRALLQEYLPTDSEDNLEQTPTSTNAEGVAPTPSSATSLAVAPPSSAAAATPDPSTDPNLELEAEAEPIEQSMASMMASTLPANANTWVVLSATGTRRIDLSPIIAFENQESDDLDRLMDEHAAKVDERAQLFDLMREAAYTDPILHIVKRCFREQVEVAITQHQRAQIRQRVQQEQQRIEASQAAAAALLKDEEEARLRERDRLAQKAKDQERRVVERQQAELKARQQLAAIDERIKQQEQEAEAKKRQLELEHRKQVEAALAEQEETARRLFEAQRQAQLKEEQAKAAAAKSVSEPTSKPSVPRNADKQPTTTPSPHTTTRSSERSSKRTSRRNRARAKARATADPTNTTTSSAALSQPSPSAASQSTSLGLASQSTASIAASSGTIPANRKSLAPPRVRTTSASAPTSPQQAPQPQLQRPSSYTGTKSASSPNSVAQSWGPVLAPAPTASVEPKGTWADSMGLNGSAAPFVPGLTGAPQQPLYPDWSVGIASDHSAWGSGLLSAYPTGIPAPDPSLTEEGDADSQALPNDIELEKEAARLLEF